jgi:hypothetical protein
MEALVKNRKKMTLGELIFEFDRDSWGFVTEPLADVLMRYIPIEDREEIVWVTYSLSVEKVGCLLRFDSSWEVAGYILPKGPKSSLIEETENGFKITMTTKWI